MSSHPSRRVVQAQETKQAILDAALALFSRRGYGAVSMPEIAAAAGVAVPTVYASVGTKPDLLRLMLDRVEEQSHIAEHAVRVTEAGEARGALAAQVALTRAVTEESGDVVAALRSAAGVEPDLAMAYQEGMARHRRGARLAVDRISGLGGLRPGLSPERAAAMLATLTLPAGWEAVTIDHGWAFDEAEIWLTEALAAQLLSVVGR
jgi:AcrR family transcriptional regulator